MSPREVDACSLWEMAIMVDAFNKANGGEETEEMTHDELSDLSALLDAAPLIKRST